MTKTLNVALIGAGFHATTTLLPTLIHLPIRLQAVVDRDAERAQATATQFGCTAYTDTQDCYAQEVGLDAVLLCAGPGQHPTLIAEAINAGLHVWSEKPAAKSVASIDTIAPLVEASDMVVMVGYKKAFMPAVTKIKELLNRADSGALHHIHAQYPIGLPGGWHANSCHPMAFMLACGGPVKRLRLHSEAGGGGTLSMEFRDGAIGTLLLARSSRGLSERYQLFCEETHIELEDGHSINWHRGQRSGDNDMWVGAGDDHGTVTWKVQNCFARRDNRLEMTQGFHHEIRAFYDAIQNGEAPALGNLDYARALTEIDVLVAELDHDNWVQCTAKDWRHSNQNHAKQTVEALS